MKILNVIVNIITWGLVILALLLRFSPVKSYEILSGSMEPNLKVGNVVLVNTLDKDTEIDDVIAFKMGDVPVIHRVIGFEEDGIVTKGDANVSRDPGVLHKENVIGKVLLNPGALSIIISILTNHTVAVVVILIILNIVTDRKRGDENEHKKENIS